MARPMPARMFARMARSETLKSACGSRAERAMALSFWLSARISPAICTLGFCFNASSIA